jgi:pimeloyl-ACP methyl ester carboxylesterase
MPGIGYFVSPEGRTRFFAAYDEAVRLGPEPRERHDVPTTYGQVRVHRHGQDGGAPIVLLHGRNATSAMWEPNVAGLAATHPVYTVDTLGEAGRSVQALPIRGGADHAVWLEETLAALGLDDVHLVGASAGGWLAFNQAVHAPKRIASVTLLDPAQVLGRFPAKFVVGALTTAPGMPSTLTERFLSWVSGGPRMDTPVARVLVAGMREYRTVLPMPTYASDEVLRSVRTPVLALLGGRSVVHDPVVAQRRAVTLLPRAEAEVWPEASHAISGEVPDRVNERILRFVEEQATAQRRRLS